MKGKDINSVIDYLSEISHILEKDIEGEIEEVEEVINKSIDPNLWFFKYISCIVTLLIVFFIAVAKYQEFNTINISILRSERGLLYFIVGLLSLYCLS